ncbi:MAG: ornithine carbamoyltransferase [Anaerolineae bacterium]
MKKDLISLADLCTSELEGLINQAVALKAQWRGGGNPPLLAGQTLAMVFQKPSLRTRVSFEMAMYHLGGRALYLSPDEIGLGKRESVADVARVLSRYVQGIMARVFAHAHVVELAQYATVPVINGLSDYSHPCQGLADLLTVYEKFGRFQGITLAFVGDANNVLTSLLYGACKLGMHVISANPVGYQPNPQVLAQARAFAAESGGSVQVTDDAKAAVRGAEVIYTDVWTSMGQEAEREKRLKVFPPYQVNAGLIAGASPHAIVLHCLPAHRGEEITDEVMDGPHCAAFDQAENRMHAQKAVLVHLMAARQQS